MTFGISSKNPLDYTGPQLNTVPIRRFPRRPLTTDTRYNIGQIVILGPSPTTGSEGEIWYLSRFSGGSAIWLQLSSGGTVSGIDFIESDDGAPACPPDATGTIGIIGSNGIVTSGQSPLTDITIALDCITCTASGEVTKPLTPSFLATTNAGNAQNNVTGNGATYTFLYHTEVYDVNADFLSPNFTAPVTGKYELFFGFSVGGVDALANSGYLTGVTSNRSYSVFASNFANIRDSSNFVGVYESFIADMDAGDTAHIEILVSGMGGDTIDVNVAATAANLFGGFLLG